jgi:hypothetical protein
MSATITDSEKVKMLAPKLRFQGFNDQWKNKKFGDIAQFQKGKGISKINIQIAQMFLNSVCEL